MSSIFIPVLISERSAKLAQGKEQGYVDGLVYSVEKIRSTFGEVTTPVEYEAVYSVKTSTVISVEENGIKTVKVIP
jgi:hypothetical protein